jgi:hypothetical protein
MFKLSVVLLVLIRIPPPHQFSILWVGDEMPQAVSNWEVAHNHARNSALLLTDA